VVTDDFEIAFGSTIGNDHKLLGRNNQDYFVVKKNNDKIVGIVCDGCGSGAHSEVGAKIGANIIVDRIMSSTNLTPAIRKVLHSEIAHIAAMMCGDSSKVNTVIWDYFLFTIMGFIIEKDKTVIFSIGDGVYSLNGEKYAIEYENNAPPYIMYENSTFKLLQTVDTKDLNSLIIGSDGLNDIERCKDNLDPFGKNLIGGIDQFVDGDKYFYNRDNVRRRLDIINRSLTTVVDGNIIKTKGVLRDDTTLIAVRRKIVQN
jgi:hypothetical protein